MENTFENNNIPQELQQPQIPVMQPQEAAAPVAPQQTCEQIDQQPVQQQSAVPPQQTVQQQIPVPPQQPVYQQVPPQNWQYSPVYWQAPAQPEKPKRESTGRAKKVLSCIGITVAALALVAVSCFVTNLLVANSWQKEADSLSKKYEEQYKNLGDAADNRIAAMQEQIDELQRQLETANSSAGTEQTDGDLLPNQVYAQNVNAVVAVTSEGVTTNLFGQPSKTASIGTGFIISADGYVVTNYHVIKGGTTIAVITHDGKEHSATVVGYDADNDLAVLKMEGENHPHVTIGSSDALGVGERVAAIGNPLGELTSTMTVGYVSAKDRMITTDGTSLNMIQTDAAINSGNSGGPLFNMKGEVVGITTAKYSGTSSSGASIEGIGFAIPIDDVLSMITDLRDYGYVKGAYLGVYIREIDSSVAQLYNLPAGVYVESTIDGYCAQAAGIEAADIIIDIGGYEVACMSDLNRVLRKFEPGQTTTITVMRSGAKVHLQIVLDERPQETEEETSEPNTEQQTIMPDYGGFGGYGDFFEYFFGN